MGFFDKLFGKKEKEQLEKGLEKTREGFFSKITKAIAGKSQVDEEVLDQLEEALITADVGVDTTVQIIEKIDNFRQKIEYNFNDVKKFVENIKIYNDVSNKKTVYTDEQFEKDLKKWLNEHKKY